MALSDRSRESLLPSFLYSPAATARPFAGASRFSATPAPGVDGGVPLPFTAQVPREKIEMYTRRRSMPPARPEASPAAGSPTWPSRPRPRQSITSGFGILAKEQGVRGFFRGWVPTLLGYNAQGACKFGFYEFFKKYKTLIYLAGSASAEVIADVALCPFEAVKVRVQTQPGFARRLSDGLPKFIKSEGALGLVIHISSFFNLSLFLYTLIPLVLKHFLVKPAGFARVLSHFEIPYTMMKFASFETIVELIYKHVVPVPKSECSKPFQLGISFAGGYIAGVFCAIVSHPADNLVSLLNNAKGATVGDN
ncbi:hypothetical protein U9M48_029329 [Paspalum notatum var. saurae]|uniref:Uncharacterized protein n=1 Tax=Paspalum notatum var. saurae TaxID=547442 RepID=A0AAQ3U198_PASNO